MFRGKLNNPLLFEDVVFQLLKWKGVAGEYVVGWGGEDLNLTFVMVTKYKETEVLTAMQTGVLYRPLNPNFEACDMLWWDEMNQVCCIQVTFAKEHEHVKR